MNLPFATHQNFLDPLTTKDENGNEVPYGPIRYKEIVKECYIISKNCATSYTDLMNITPTEKNFMLGFIVEEAKKTKEEIEKNREALMFNQ